MDDIRVSYHAENEFACCLPVVEEFIVTLVVSLGFHDFQKFAAKYGADYTGEQPVNNNYK